MIESKEVRECWINKIFVAPVPISNDVVRIDVYSIENGKLVTIRKGKRMFNQKTKKDKDLIYENVLSAYKYYYNKL